MKNDGQPIRDSVPWNSLLRKILVGWTRFFFLALKFGRNRKKNQPVWSAPNTWHLKPALWKYVKEAEPFNPIFQTLLLQLQLGTERGSSFWLFTDGRVNRDEMLPDSPIWCIHTKVIVFYHCFVTIIMKWSCSWNIDLYNIWFYGNTTHLFWHNHLHLYDQNDLSS